jgi:hypothetical protein
MLSRNVKVKIYCNEYRFCCVLVRTVQENCGTALNLNGKLE